MQCIARDVHVAQFTRRRASVARPRDAGRDGEARREREPIGEGEPVPRQACRQNERKHEANLADLAELRFLQYRLEHARIHGFAERDSAHRGCFDQHPDHTGKYRHAQTDPRQSGDLGAQAIGHLT